MCRVITPDDPGAHSHADDPLSIAELLRETLSDELQAMNDLAARWHMIEDEDVTHALKHVIDAKRKGIKDLWNTLLEVEGRAFSGPHDHGHTHEHSHTHDHSH
ncbi:MAG: hypothetical protein U9R40_04355 [Synergistota bacterium]|nr:hypothetical protein [Synergistota bacterium]